MADQGMGPLTPIEESIPVGLGSVIARPARCVVTSAGPAFLRRVGAPKLRLFAAECKGRRR
jgi:hypothetical protein